MTMKTALPTDYLTTQYHWGETLCSESSSSSDSQVITPRRKLKVKVPYYSKEKKILDDIWESDPLTIASYRYKLVVRPKGLKYTTGYGKAVGMWFRPLPCHLLKPAKVKISIGVLKSDGKEVMTVIKEKEYEWDEEDTRSDYPAFNFDLDTFRHSYVEEKCEMDSAGCITVIINEH